jgi:hypothetical protein
MSWMAIVGTDPSRTGVHEMSVPAPASVVDNIFDYPLHEEDDVPEGSLHRRWSTYLGYVLEARFPHSFVTGNVCVYWEPRNFTGYVAPDVFLAAGQVPDPPPRVYRSWLLPPLRFAAEIGSVATAQRGAKLGDYAAHLQPSEVLYTEPVDEDAGEMLAPEQVHLYRWSGTAYVEVERQPNGRVWSEVLDLEVGVDEDRNLRLYTSAGEPQFYYPEAEQERAREAQARVLAEQERAREAQARILAERARAEAEQARAQAEQERAREAEARVLAEQERAREAEARAEAERRAAAETARREALERQLAELQARLEREQEAP